MPELLTETTRVRPQPTAQTDIRIKTNPWGITTPPERTYGPPQDVGKGARKAVRKYGEVLKRLSER